jgi:MFS superfamily sulfate permease-like transporter
MFALKHSYRFDPNQELLGIAGANVMGGLGHGFPVSGGMSQSLVNESGGARTPLSGLIAALLMLLVVVFVSGALRYLPQPVLAAIVLVAVTGLFKLSALKHLWRGDRAEFVVAMAALLGVLGSGLLRGVLIGAVISLVQLLRRASRPHVAFLGRIPGTRRFSDMARHADNEPVPGALIVRTESSLLYFNAEHVRDRVAARLRAEGTPPRIVVLDLSASPHVDMHACAVLMNLADDIKAVGARLQIVEARSSVRDRLRAEGIEERVSPINRFTSVADAVENFQKENAQRP